MGRREFLMVDMGLKIIIIDDDSGIVDYIKSFLGDKLQWICMLLGRWKTIRYWIFKP